MLTPVYPIRVRVPRLGVDAPIVPVVVSGSGFLGVPSDPRTVGWWAGGALPGADSGSAVLVGHVDSATAGAGALFQLRRLVPGDVVVVQGGGGAVQYRITGLREYHKANLPADQIFARNGIARLVMITCGGSFDTQTHHYQDNVIAYGKRVNSSASGTSRLIPNPS
jgi:sortase (surface protein transpeptidase)